MATDPPIEPAPLSRGRRKSVPPADIEMEAKLSVRMQRKGRDILDLLLGKPLSTDEEEHEHIGPAAGIPILGLDALSSSAYGPEAALTLLIPLGAVGLAYIGPLVLAILIILGLVYLSYRQTIQAYPGGGGSYAVAKENLGTKPALIAGAALAVDYILNVAVGISAGIGALVSAVPALLPYTMWLCLLTLALLTIVNLRGVREAGLAFMVPTYAFVVSLLIVVGVGLTKAALHGGHPEAVVAPPAVPIATESVTLWLVAKAFAAGCTAMTGVEAVSNGVPMFRKPTVPNAQRTLTAIVVVLMVLLAGIAYLTRAYGIAATEPGAEGYQSVLSMLITAVMGRGVFYYASIVAIVTVLALSANTSFAGFPGLCRVLAEDRFLPDSFAVRGRRLVFSQGIIVLAVLSGVLIVVFKGITDPLIPLFAIGAFLAFTASQAGMVQHWRKVGGPEARTALPLNALGAVATAITLVVVAVSKFGDGAWITVVVVPLIVLGFLGINRHYRSVAQQIVTTSPLEIASATRPLVVVAVQSWNRLTEGGLRFALTLSPHVYGVQVKSEAAKMRDLTTDWEKLVATPCRAAKVDPPKLVILSSRYRQLFTPFINFVLQLRDDNPDRSVVVIIPDLVVYRWYQGLLHNNRGAILRTLLRLRGGGRVIIVNTPFYLH